MCEGVWLGGLARDVFGGDVFGGVLWRGFFGAMGFTHPQWNFADSIRMRKRMIPFHATWGLSGFLLQVGG